MPRFVRTLAQYRQLSVYAFLDESSSFWVVSESVDCEGEVCGVINVGGGVRRISFIDPGNLLSGSSSSSDSVSLVSSLSSNAGGLGFGRIGMVKLSGLILDEGANPNNRSELLDLSIPLSWLGRGNSSLRCRRHCSAIVLATFAWALNSSIRRLRLSSAESNNALVDPDSVSFSSVGIVEDVVVVVVIGIELGDIRRKGAGRGPPEKLRRIDALARRSALNDPMPELASLETILGALERIVLMDIEGGDEPEGGEGLTGRRSVSGAGDIDHLSASVNHWQVMLIIILLCIQRRWKGDGLEWRGFLIGGGGGPWSVCERVRLTALRMTNKGTASASHLFSLSPF